MDDDFAVSMRYMDARHRWVIREMNRRWIKAHFSMVVCGIVAMLSVLIFNNLTVSIIVMIIPMVIAVVCSSQTFPPRMQREYDGMHHEEPEYFAYLRMKGSD